MVKNISKVYFIKLNEIDEIKKLLPEFKGKIGVKVHFGEEGNITYVPAKLVKQIVQMVENPTLIETSVLYKSSRSLAKTHKELAIKHGFDFAPIDILDGEKGDDSLLVEINGKHFKECYLGKNLQNYDSLLVISHFKGHCESRFGGALKNLGMGLASRRGKLAQHSNVKHHIKKEKCSSCGTCLENCPVAAIVFDENKKAEINQGKCISCSKCIAVCPTGAVRIPWGTPGKEFFQERVAEYAKAASQGRNCFYINFLINITKDCDCMDKELEIITPDIGILASSDPVALDQASYDLVVKQYPEFANFYGESQLKHAQELGLGSKDYELIYL